MKKIILVVGGAGFKSAGRPSTSSGRSSDINYFNISLFQFEDVI